MGDFGLPSLPMEGVLLVPAAVLLHLDALAVVDARLHRDVVAALAHLAGQRDLDPLLIGLRRHLASLSLRCYLLILVTRPAPTVRPPSRMAKRRPSSMAIGLPNDTVISVLSPGITISVPEGRSQAPVMSVVRK